MIASRIWRALVSVPDNASTLRGRQVVPVLAHVLARQCRAPAATFRSTRIRCRAPAPRPGAVSTGRDRQACRCRQARRRRGSVLRRRAGSREARARALPAPRSRSRGSARACPAGPRGCPARCRSNTARRRRRACAERKACHDDGRTDDATFAWPYVAMPRSRDSMAGHCVHRCLALVRRPRVAPGTAPSRESPRRTG